jgi:hypothetical protein
MALKANEIKKHVIGGADVKRAPAPLYVGEHDGEMWATNRYWLTRAERVAPLLEQYNLSASEPGGFEVNGTVRRATGAHQISPQPPNFDAFMRSQRDYAPGVPVRVAGQQAYTRHERFGLYAAYILADGSYAGLNADTLEWLSDTMTAPLPEQEDGTYLRYGDLRVSFHRAAQGGITAMVSAEVIHVIERSRYTDKVEGEKQEYVPAVEEACEPRVLGIMMGMNYGA